MTTKQLKLHNKSTDISLAGVEFARKYAECSLDEINGLIKEWFATVDRIMGVKL